MYKDIYSPIPDVDAYLKRIGIEDGKPEATRENLDRIVMAHLTHVPFENLDVCLDKVCPELGVTALYTKIVEKNRGGYCFELNGAFYALIKALGYDAYCVACRIRYGHNLFMPLSHRATIVIIDGVKHFCDVGYGGPSAHCCIPYNETVTGGFYIACDGNETQVRRKTADNDELIITFVDMPFEPIDFIPLNFHVSMAPGSFFQMMPIINLTTETGSRSINGDVYRCHDNGKVTEVKLENDEMFKACLKDRFGIVK